MRVVAWILTVFLCVGGVLFTLVWPDVFGPQGQLGNLSAAGTELHLGLLALALGMAGGLVLLFSADA